jgi:hypothetical protein
VSRSNRVRRSSGGGLHLVMILIHLVHLVSSVVTVHVVHLSGASN